MKILSRVWVERGFKGVRAAKIQVKGEMLKALLWLRFPPGKLSGTNVPFFSLYPAWLNADRQTDFPFCPCSSALVRTHARLRARTLALSKLVKTKQPIRKLESCRSLERSIEAF